MTDRALIIAEAGVNHNGDLDLARRLVDAAAQAGADLVKFQTFKADRLATRDAPKAAYQLETTGAAESQHAMLRRLELSLEAHHALIAHCRDRGIGFLSTPFDEESADLLAGLGIDRFKIPSGEVVNLPFLAHVARYGRPIILSTGMAELDEVGTAVATVRASGNPPLCLLHCTTAYPADPADANLRAMRTMAEAFGVPVGYSDHTPGLEVALAAVALGAAVVEKHFTLDRTLPGPDHRASLEPDELTALVRGIRTVEAALGDGRKTVAPGERANRDVVRKSVVAARFVAVGTVLGADDVAIRRPGTGLPPAERERTIGRTARVDIPEGAPITAEMLA